MTTLQTTIDAVPASKGQLPAAAPAVSAKTWLAVIGATLGAFMAVLNIQIVNASLADIQGGIGAGIDDGGWISTSYLIAEIVVIPLSGWLAQVFSVRIYLLTNAFLFLVFSAACALAQDLPQMIALRAVQGFTGGVLIPMAFTLIITLLPKAKQPIGLAMFAISATFAPAIGPTIGGYLTENFGWEYIFYVNVVPGAIMIAMLYFSLEAKPMKLSLLREGDWAGIITMAIGLAALQTVLEEGNKDDWFGSPFIVRLAVIAAIALTLFLAIELTASKPLLNLRILFRRNFGFGVLANFLLGVSLYGSVYILPVYLSRIQFNPERRMTMKPRMNFYQAAPESIKALTAVETQIQSSGLEQPLIELVRTRASQINGCAFCINMHTQDARKHGETEQRLYLLNAWREAPLYTDRERAALAWTEAVTLISETHAPDDVYEELRKHFSEAEAVNLTILVGTINAWNRLAVSFRAVPPVKAKAATAA